MSSLISFQVRERVRPVAPAQTLRPIPLTGMNVLTVHGLVAQEVKHALAQVLGCPGRRGVVGTERFGEGVRDDSSRRHAVDPDPGVPRRHEVLVERLREALERELARAVWK